MIYVDLEREEIEYECSGEDMAKEIAILLASSVQDMERDYDCLPVDVHAEEVIDDITAMIGEIAKMLYRALKEGVEANEEEEADEERSGEVVETRIKRFRRRTS